MIPTFLVRFVYKTTERQFTGSWNIIAWRRTILRNYGVEVRREVPTTDNWDGCVGSPPEFPVRLYSSKPLELSYQLSPFIRIRILSLPLFLNYDLQ